MFSGVDSDLFFDCGYGPPKFQIIYADPPWTFKTYSAKGKGKSAEKHYPCMTLADIKKLPVESIAAKDAVLFIWVPFPHLPQGLEVIEAWGFKYKTIGFVWVKTTKFDIGGFHWGCGYWTRANAEVCLLATRGHPKRKSGGVHQIVAERIRNHSQKPDVVRSRITDLLGHLPRIELFARTKTPGWSVWGNEVESDIRL